MRFGNQRGGIPFRFEGTKATSIPFASTLVPQSCVSSIIEIKDYIEMTSFHYIQMSESVQKCPKMIKNDSQNVWKCPKSPLLSLSFLKMFQNDSKMIKKDSKMSETVSKFSENAPKVHYCLEVFWKCRKKCLKMFQNDSKMSENVQKCPKKLQKCPRMSEKFASTLAKLLCFILNWNERLYWNDSFASPWNRQRPQAVNAWRPERSSHGKKIKMQPTISSSSFSTKTTKYSVPFQLK